MASIPRDGPLENHDRNPCIGCGPRHESGLRLRFRKEKGRVVSRLVAHDDMQGFPGRLHSGLLYLAMLECANWTLYGMLGRIGIPAETSALRLARWVATGETLFLSGRLDGEGPNGAEVAVEALDEDHEHVASLTRRYALVDRAEFLKRMGYNAVPAGLEEALPR